MVVLKINNVSFNVFCYADDLMLASLSVTGLQNMIEVSSRYIRNHGLRFNPQKTNCVIFGNRTLSPHPDWSLDSVRLAECDSVSYLGVILSSSNPNEHITNRINACRKAFYGLQGAGFSNSNIDSNVLSYVWNAAIRPVLTYGINCVHVSKSSLNEAEKIQAKLLKAGFGIHKFCRNTPFLKALNVMTIEK